MARRVVNIARNRWKWVSNNPFADVAFSDIQAIDNAMDRWLTMEEERVLLENSSLPISAM